MARNRPIALPLAVAIAGMSVLFSLQLGVNGPAMENRLRAAVQDQLVRGGLGGVTVTVSGQDVVISPTTASAEDVDRAVELAAEVEGVHLARASGVARAAAETRPEPAPTQLTASILGGEIRLTGAVPGEGSRNRLLAAAGSVVGEDRVDSSVLVVDGTDDDAVQAIIAVVEVLDPASNGSVTLTGGTLSLAGRVPSQAARDAEVAAANGVLGDPARIMDQLTIEDTKLGRSDLAVERRLAGLPELSFAAGGALRSSSLESVQEAAGILDDAPTLRVRVEGRTTSAGSAGSNLELSRKRAETVRDALVSAGLDADRIDAVGYGERDRTEVDPTTGAPTADPDDEDRQIRFEVLR